MIERPAHDERPTLRDYQTMMSKVRASDELKHRVRQAARVRRSDPAPCRRRHPKPTPRVRRLALRSFAAAACLAIAIGGVALAGNLLDWPRLYSDAGTGGAGGNSFTLAAYAAENPEGQSGKTVELDSKEFTGGQGFSGSWYNPADHTFWDEDWAGYKYSFALNCVGNNISFITYEIQGDRSYFETIDNKVTAEDVEKGAHVFSYSKTVSFDYDQQSSISDDRIVSLYIGFPLSEEGEQAYQEQIAGHYTKESEKTVDTAIEKGAAEEISKSRLKLTATFKDGSTQSKSFVIRPVDDFDARYSEFFDASYASLHQSSPSPDAPQEKTQATGAQKLSIPKLYNITEVSGE